MAPGDIPEGKVLLPGAGVLAWDALVDFSSV